jgi:hypothetical protein
MAMENPDMFNLVGGLNHFEKYESQWEGLFHMIVNI